MSFFETGQTYCAFLNLIRFTIVLKAPEFSGDTSLLLKNLKDLKKRKSFFTEIRPHRVLDDSEEKCYKREGFKKYNHLNAFILLDSEENVWRKMDDDKQKGISSAQKNDIIIREESDESGLKKAYSILKQTYERKRMWLRSWATFHDLLVRSEIKILNAYYHDQCIATQIYYFDHNRIVAFYTATDHKFKNLHAGDLLIWELIQIGIKLGYKILDLGGAGDPAVPYGVREYKKRFGATMENVGRYVYSPFNMYGAIKFLYKIVSR